MARVGDKAIVHLQGMRCAGIVSLTSDYFYKIDKIWQDGVYPHRVAFEEDLVLPQPISIKQLYDESFREEKRKASGYFRKSTRILPENEFEKFLEYVKAYSEVVNTN